MAEVRFTEEPGWLGLFTRNEAPGLLPNGTRVVKVATERGDTHQLGAQATVLGSFGAKGIAGYFVEWDDHPQCAVFVCAEKLARAP